jgi:excisionase family DNA binding protein
MRIEIDLDPEQLRPIIAEIVRDVLGGKTESIGSPARATSPEKLSLVAGGLATIPEAAKFLGVSKSQVYVWMKRKQLPFSKLGAARRIPWRAVHQMAADMLVD